MEFKDLLNRYEEKKKQYGRQMIKHISAVYPGRET